MLNIILIRSDIPTLAIQNKIDLTEWYGCLDAYIEREVRLLVLAEEENLSLKMGKISNHTY